MRAVPPQGDAAVAAVDALFAAMKARDCEAMRALVVPGARIYRLGEGGELAIVTDEEFVEGVCKGERVIDELRTEAARVEIRGDLASVWAPYDVRVDGEYHHAGVDAVHLQRGPDRWRVLAISYTTELPAP